MRVNSVHQKSVCLTRVGKLFTREHQDIRQISFQSQSHSAQFQNQLSSLQFSTIHILETMSLPVSSRRLAATAHYKLHQESLKSDSKLHRLLAHVTLLDRIHESQDIVERFSHITTHDSWIIPQKGPAYEDEDYYSAESQLVMDSSSDSSNDSSDDNSFKDSECYITKVVHIETCITENDNVSPCDRDCTGVNIQELLEDEWNESDDEGPDYNTLTRVSSNSDGGCMNIATQMAIERSQSTPRTINISRKLSGKKRGRCVPEEQELPERSKNKLTRNSCTPS